MDTAAESIAQPETSHPAWGGKRAGAGRRPRDAEKWIRARGISPASAAELLERADERRIWYRLLNSQDDRVVLDAVKFLTSMRDGKPAQRINVTSTQLQLNANDLDRARAIVREIRDKLPPDAQLGQGSPLQVDAGTSDSPEALDEALPLCQRS